MVNSYDCAQTPDSSIGVQFASIRRPTETIKHSIRLLATCSLAALFRTQFEISILQFAIKHSTGWLKHSDSPAASKAPRGATREWPCRRGRQAAILGHQHQNQFPLFEMRFAGPNQPAKRISKRGNQGASDPLPRAAFVPHFATGLLSRRPSRTLFSLAALGTFFRIVILESIQIHWPKQPSGSNCAF